MKVLIFGTGDYYQKYKKWFVNVDIIALLDNNPHKQNQKLDGVEIVSPEDGTKRAFDAIFILSVHEDSMRKQLLQLGISNTVIYTFSDIHNCEELLCNRKYVTFCAPETDMLNLTLCGREHILLMSHNMDLNGATLALFYMAKIIKKNGNEVLFASWEDGELREYLEKEKMPFVIDPNLQICTYEEIAWVHKFDRIICNTLNYYLFLANRDESKKIIWWLHDPIMFYRSLDMKVLEKISNNNLYIYAVGMISEAAFKTYKPQFEVKQLVYGIPDSERVTGENSKAKKLEFITIGNVQEYKGQDVLISAIKKIPDSYYNSVHFTILGNQQSLFATKLKEEARDISEIVTFRTPVGRDGIHIALEGTDVLICPSRVDTMSIVTTEAMMHEIPCIVSDAAGISSYIANECDSIIIPNEDVEYLAQKIVWCIENRDELVGMGKRARLIYEKYFSMQVFEKNVLEVMEEVYKK